MTIIEINKASKLLPIFIPMPKKDAVCAVAALKEALTMCDNRNLQEIPESRIVRIQDHLNPSTDLNELEKGMPWRTIQDEFGKFKWVDHTGRIYQGTPFSIEPDVTSKHIFVASMMHTSMRSPVLRDTPDVTCPSDFPDSDHRKEVVHHEQISWPGYVQAAKECSWQEVQCSHQS